MPKAGLELSMPRAQKARAKNSGGSKSAPVGCATAAAREGRPDLPKEQLVVAQETNPSPAGRPSPEDLFAGICPKEPVESLTPRRRAAAAPQSRRRDVVIPASEFLTSSRVDGRPVRQRFPVLERWRNESLVYERPKDSLCPIVRGVTVEDRPPPTPMQARRAATPAARRPPTPPRSRPTATPASRPRAPPGPRSRERSPAERVADLSAIAADQPAQMVLAQPLCRRLWPEDSSAPSTAEAPDDVEDQAEDQAEDRGLRLVPNDSSRCPHCLRDGAPPPALPVATRRRPDAKSLTSILRQRGQPRRTGSIKISEDAPATVDIKNFGHMSCDLWYQGYAVECDRCEQHLDWGKEGSLVGGAGHSRFTQAQALCNSCLAERLYGEIGVWLIVALAACGKKGGNEDGDRQKGAVAQGPIRQLLDALLRLSHSTRSDQLVALLGQEVAAPEVRSVVLQKARCGVSLLLGGSTAASPEKPADDSPAPARSHARLKVARSRTLHPRGWKRRGIVEAACKRRRATPPGSEPSECHPAVDQAHEGVEHDSPPCEDAL